jgi:hypothetical protein
MNHELDRMKQDLETISAAAGFGQPPLGAEDVHSLCLLGIAGMAVAAGSWLGGGLSCGAMTLVAFLACLGAVLYFHFWYTRGKRRTPARDRAYLASSWLGLLLGVLIGGFCVWAKFLAGLQGPTFLFASFLFSGALLVLLALTHKWRLCLLGWAVPLLLLGGAGPVLSPAVFHPMIGVAMALGGFTSAAILHLQLKSHGIQGQATH